MDKANVLIGLARIYLNYCKVMQINFGVTVYFFLGNWGGSVALQPQTCPLGGKWGVHVGPSCDLVYRLVLWFSAAVQAWRPACCPLGLTAF